MLKLEISKLGFAKNLPKYGIFNMPQKIVLNSILKYYDSPVGILLFQDTL